MKANKRDRIVKVRLTNLEYEELTKASKSSKCMSDYFRQRVFRKGVGLIDPKEFIRSMDEICLEMKRIGNNINQLARYVNIHKEEVNQEVLNEVEKGGFSIYVDRFRKFLKLEDKYPEFKDLYKRVIRPVYDDLFEQADCWFEMAEVYRNSGDTQPYKLNFKVIKSALSKKEEELLKGQKKMITNFCSLHFAMKDEHLQQFIPQITLSNYKAVVTKMLYLGEYVRDNWNKISNKAEYCLSVLLKEVEILPGMIGEEKKDE